MRKEVIGKCELSNEDCMELLARYADKHFDLAIVDPPYGIGSAREFTGMIRNKKALWHNTVGYQKKGWDKKPPSKKYFNELFRVSKQQIIWGGNYYELVLTGGWIIWDKSVSMPTLSKCELAWTSFLKHTELFRFLWAGFRKGEPVKRIHPTQKPVALYKWLLTNYAKPGDLILDTHLGSGSSAVACNELGFSLTGSELDSGYFEAACLRIKKAFRDHTDLFAAG